MPEIKKSLDNYPDVLEPKDIQEILRIGRKQTYELFQQDPPPFHYIRVGRTYKISKSVFIKWLNGDRDE